MRRADERELKSHWTPVSVRLASLSLKATLLWWLARFWLKLLRCSCFAVHTVEVGSFRGVLFGPASLAQFSVCLGVLGGWLVSWRFVPTAASLLVFAVCLYVHCRSDRFVVVAVAA